MTKATRSYVSQLHYHLSNQNTVFEDTITEKQTLFNNAITYVSNEVRKLRVCKTTALGGFVMERLLRFNILLSWYLSIWTHETCKQSVSIGLFWKGPKITPVTSRIQLAETTLFSFSYFLVPIS